MDMDMDDDGDEGLEDRVMDLEDSLEELKREFEELMGDQGGEDMGGDMDADMGDEEMMPETLEVVPDMDHRSPKNPSGPMESKMKKEEMLKDKKAKAKKKMTEAEWIREYVEKIGEQIFVLLLLARRILRGAEQLVVKILLAHQSI